MPGVAEHRRARCELVIDVLLWPKKPRVGGAEDAELRRSRLDCSGTAPGAAVAASWWEARRIQVGTLETKVASVARQLFVAGAICISCILAGCSSGQSQGARQGAACGDPNSAPCPIKQICTTDANGAGAHCQTPPACGLGQSPERHCQGDGDCATSYYCSLFLGVCLGGYCPGGNECDADNTHCIAAPQSCGTRDYGFDSCGPGTTGCPPGDLCTDLGSGPVCVGTACVSDGSDKWTCTAGDFDVHGVSHGALCVPYACSAAEDCPAGSFCNCDEFQGAPSPKCGPGGIGNCASNVGGFGACGQPFGNSVTLPASTPGGDSLLPFIARDFVLCDPAANCPKGQVCSGGVCVGSDCKGAGEVCSPVPGVVPTLYGPAAMTCVASPDGGSSAGEAGAPSNSRGTPGSGGGDSAG
jgi:hypothetical protein